MLNTVYGYADSIRTVARQQKECMQKSFDALISGSDSKSRKFSTVAEPSYPIKAECYVGPAGKVCGGGAEQAPTCVGKVTFEQPSVDICNISWELTGCGREGKHGFHIHEKADFSDGCNSAGPHYNPFGKTHGDPDDEERHVGDMGNIFVDAKGSSSGSLKDHLIKLHGETSVLGRSVMVHADEDDLGRGDNSKAGEAGPPQNGFVSKMTGNAGARIACGEIVMV